MEKIFTYLALGDSYTIGESVPLRESFPLQTVQMLRQKGFAFAAPEIVAMTGWTTDELAKAIDFYTFLPKYDFVTLLIGVNNQYRGRDTENYKLEFNGLLDRAVAFAGGQKEHVVIVSIPDYGVTPFAKNRDRARIASEIEQFNATAKIIASRKNVPFIDITGESRDALFDPSLIAADGLHPSAKEYAKWAEKVASYIADLFVGDKTRN